MVFVILFRLYIPSTMNSREEQPVPYHSSLLKANWKVQATNLSNLSTDKI